MVPLRPLVARFLAATLVAGVAAGCVGGSAAPRPRSASSTEQGSPPPSSTPSGGTTAGRRSRPSEPRLPAAPAIHVPRGFRAERYASGLHDPTAMAFGPDGRLYVSEDVGRLVAVRPGTSRPRVVLGGLRVPLGLAWRGRDLFVSEQGLLERARLEHGRLAGRRTVVHGLPFGRHQQDNVVVRGGRLVFGSGSTCDVCDEQSPLSAAILSVRPDGSGLRVLARGLRNPFGLALDPRSGQLLATVNGRDDLGTAEPADILVRVRAGADYGWPDCWPDVFRRALAGACAGVTAPVAYLAPHSSADGFAVYSGDAFPGRYRGDAFVAEWGEYAPTDVGRVVVRVPLHGPAAGRARTFATGFEHPIAVLEDGAGALLVADWGRGEIYRIAARRPR